jgi:DNA recombination protein RmuC
MNNLVLEPLSLLIGLGVGALAVAAFLLPTLARYRARLNSEREEFESLAAATLRQTQDDFLKLASEKIAAAQNNAAQDLNLRQQAIENLVTPIATSLKDMQLKVEGLNRTGHGLEVQLKSFTEDQRSLREQTENLVRALRNPTARGKWGEMQLQRAFELVGFIEGVHYSAQSMMRQDGQSLRPDFIVKLPNGINIIIDVKTPLDPYWEYLDQGQPHDAEPTRIQFRQKIRDHMKSLSSKEYWRGLDTPEFVVMFLPSESLYAFAVGSDSGLLEEASRQNIVLASPSTVMGLLRVVMYGWQQQKIADEAKSIAQLGADIYKRIGTFGDYLGRLGNGLNAAVDNYNKAIGSFEQTVLPALRRFKDLQVPTGGKDIPQPRTLETPTRSLSAPEVIETTDTKPTHLRPTGST